jgi:VCBS repeat-containing protein
MVTLADGQVVDGVNTASGSISASDNDTDAVLTYGVENDTNEYGQLTVDPVTGDWTFTFDNTSSATQCLKEGGSITSKFEMTVTDDKGAITTEESNEHFITITIVGTNDAPKIVDIGQQMATENTNIQLSGVFDDGDVDTVNIADDQLWEVVSGDPRGDLSVDPTTGAWTFDLVGDFEYLSEGETLPSPLTYEVKVTDEHGASNTVAVEFQITGTNDAPTVVAGDTDRNRNGVGCRQHRYPLSAWRYFGGGCLFGNRDIRYL